MRLVTQLESRALIWSTVTRTVLPHEVAVAAGNCYSTRAKIPLRPPRHLHDVIIRLRSFILLSVSSARARSALVKRDSSARSE